MLVYYSKRAFPGEDFEYRLRSGSFPCVKMMQSADLGNFDHPAKRGRLDRSADRRIFLEREVSSKMFVVLEVIFQDATQSVFIEDNDVI